MGISQLLRNPAQGPGIGGKLTANGGGHRVLQMRTPALYRIALAFGDACEFRGHGINRLNQSRRFR